MSELWSCMSKLLETDLHPTISYHPQANGLIERNHRDLKESLKCRLISPNWIDELPWVLLGLRTLCGAQHPKKTCVHRLLSWFMVPHSQFQAISSQTVHQDQLRNILNNKENRLVIYAPSQQQPIERTTSRPMFRAALTKGSLFLSDMTLGGPHFKLRMMVHSKLLNELRNISPYNSET